ncbi:MAG TPA: chemotaxis protein [Nitrosopumilus sp.]|nr:chemotaxis protein [Thermoproteota archaeon]HJJ22490.1 chemotaxis protein [Nitrosopumilus sp.]
MSKKTVRKKIAKVASQTRKTTKREPNPAILLKKVASVSDSNKALQKEIKVMSKIFGENQKVLISMKGMIDALTSTLEYIQKQSKQINIIEEDTQKLFSGLNQVRTQSNLVNKINDQTVKLQEEINRISNASKSQGLSQQVEDSVNSIKNNSEMIIKIAQRIDEVRDDLRKVSGKTDSFLEISSEMDKLKNSIEEIAGKTGKLETGTQIIESLKQELGKIAEGVSSTSNLDAELAAIKITIDAIASKSSKIDSLGGVIDGLKQQFDTIALKTNSVEGLSLESIKEFEGKINNIEQKMASVSDIVKRQDVSTIEFHKKSEKLFEELQAVKNVTNKSSTDSSKEMMALLKLSEYQSSIRMNAESKYGDAKDLEKMASQTAQIVNLFDRISIELGEKIPLPHEVRQWAISKIFDCADKWEIRFSDVYSVLTNAIGKDMFKEAVRIQQVRDIYGIRAVDEIRKDLNIS